MEDSKFYDALTFEDSVKIGDTVFIRWTNSHRYFRAKARVVKINRESFISELTENEASGTYKAGQSIRCPRLTTGSGGKLWSPQNRIEPEDGYKAD